MENSNNIEKILAEIKQEIKNAEPCEEMLSFDDIPYTKPSQIGGPKEAQEALEFLNDKCSVNAYRELTGNPIKVFIQKVIRKIVKFYVEPIVHEQNDVNINTVTVLNSLSSADIQKRLDNLEIQQKQLLLKIETLEKENADLRKRVSE